MEQLLLLESTQKAKKATTKVLIERIRPHSSQLVQG